VEKVHQYHVYILANEPGTVFYVGVTNDIMRRVEEHLKGLHGGFTAIRGVNRLLYFERHNYIKNAIKREKQIKNFGRAEKIELINGFNPTWEDLSSSWFSGFKD